MSSKIYSATNIGLTSHLIEVEADITNSNTRFLIVGLPDAAIQEARERVMSAVKNSGYNFPRTKVTVNLAPADIKKVGTGFDLPMAVAIMVKKKYLDLTEPDQQAIFVGELSLNGSLRPVTGILTIASYLQKWGLKRIYLPVANAAEASLIAGLEIFPIKNLGQLISHLKGKSLIEKFSNIVRPKTDFKNGLNIFNQIKGQKQAKRALVIAAGGYHNLLMVGPPGSGKTLLARCIPELMPPLSLAESLEVTKIYSLAGLLPPKQPLITKRPFRSPHHTSSGIALIGGGSFPKPGEITLAHRGVLFLDELPEFPRITLENLRQPLEDGRVTISRAAVSVEYPATFTLIAAANPCPCGFSTDPKKECTCSLMQINNYQKRISGPMLDRIDMHVEVPRVPTQDLMQKKQNKKSDDIFKKISQAHKIQGERFKNSNILYNSEMDLQLIEKFCQLDNEGQQLLKQATEKLQLSARSYHKILKISRTIADLAEEKNIKPQHLAESLQYRQTVFK